MNGACETAGDAGSREPTQTSRIGPCGALFLYSMAAGLCLCGPVLLTVAGLTGYAASLLLAGGLCTVLCAPLGVVLWAGTDSEREYNRRLVTVGLRMSGPGRPTWKRSKHPALRLGLRLSAVVDPADHLFRIDF